LAIDPTATSLNETEGEPLYDATDQPSPYTSRILDFMQDFEAANARTKDFCSELQSLNLLEDIVIQKWVGYQAPLLRGIKRVNEARLDRLTSSQRESLVEKGYYKLIVAHLISLGHIEKISK